MSLYFCDTLYMFAQYAIPFFNGPSQNTYNWKITRQVQIWEMKKQLDHQIIIWLHSCQTISKKDVAAFHPSKISCSYVYTLGHLSIWSTAWICCVNVVFQLEESIFQVRTALRIYFRLKLFTLYLSICVFCQSYFVFSAV